MMIVNRLPVDYRWMNACEAENFASGVKYPDTILVRVGGDQADLAVPVALPEVVEVPC